MSNWHPDFGPCYTPMEMLDKGIFEGIYTHAIEGIPSKYKSHPNVLGDRGPDVSINEFGVKSRQSLKEWQKKGWTTKLSPLGWWEWYLKYFEGRRDEKEDKLQISRWNSFVARHQAQITQNCDLEDVSCRPRQRQGLLQWGWDSRVAYTDDQVRDNAQRMARLSKAKLATEAFAPSPDLITLGVSAGSWLLKKGVEKVKDRPKRDRLPKSFNITRSKNPKAYLPYVSVHEEDGFVDVTGFSAGKFSAAMTDILNTSRFKNMFHEIYTRNFVIESFFVVEMLRCIELLQASGKRTISSSTLESLREKLITNTWIGSVEKAEAKAFKWNNLKRLNIALLPKQRQFLEEYATLVPRLGLKGWLLAAAPGTGKTLVGIAWHLCQDFDTTIYVVPNNTVEDVWEKTLYRFFDKVPSYYISRPNFKLTGKEEFVVCHYEHLPKLLEQLPKFRRRRMGLWVDESHNFNELTSQRTNMLIDMAKEHVEEAVLASGTPLKALGRELVPLFRIIDDLFTPSVEEKFVKTFGSTTGQVLELLEYRTNRASFKVSKHEVVQNEVREHSIPVRIPNANNYLLSTVRTEIATYITERLGHYEKMNDEIVENYFAYINEYAKQVTDQKAFDLYLSAAREMHRNFSPYVHGAEIKLCSKYEKEYILPWLKDTDRKDFKYWCSRYKYPLLVVRGEALGRVLGRRRIECCIDMVPYTGLEDIVEKATKKTVIFTNHVEVLKEICEHLELMGHSPIAVYGETNKELSDNLKRFMNDPKAKIIVATYKSLSTGVPLVEASSLVLFDSPFRNYIVEQTISRLDRLDQDSAIDIIRPYLETDGRDNLSTRSIELAEWSKELVDSILKLDKIDERFLATEYYSVAHDALIFSEAPETLYHVELVLGDNKPHTVELNPIYPNGSEFAKSRKAKDMWFYDAAVERVAMYETIEGALRANYHSWRDIVEKHGKSGFKVRVYECANPSNHRWVAPKTLVSTAAVHDAHLTRCWWAMEPVQLKPISERHWKEKDNSGKVFEYSSSGELHVEWDDDSPFIWIQLYGNEETREHSPRKVEWWLHDECNEITDINALAAYEIECMRHAIEVGNLNIPEFEGYSGGVALTTESYYESHSDRGGDYGDERDKLAMILAHSSKDLYHISFSKLPRTLKPQIPAGSEKTDPTHHTHEPQIPRICFSETIEGAVRAVYPNVKHLVKRHAGEELTWHVHKVKKGTSGSWVPSWALEEAKFVPDANLTKEWWALSDVTIEYIGTVDVKMDANGEHLKYNPYGVRGRYDHSPLDIIFNTDNVTGVFDLV